MSTNTGDNSTISLDELRKRIAEKLHNLVTQRNIHPLRDLFTGELNYDYANVTLSLPDERSQTYVAESPLVVATGGESNRFEIIYIRLADALSLTHERTLITKLLPRHPFVLFVFSNKEQNRWHFVNVRESNARKQRPLLRRITVGPEERLRTAVERMSMLDLASLQPELWEISPLRILTAHDTAFDVEAVTRTFYREYRIMFNILQKDLSRQTNDKTWAHDYALQFLNRCMFLYFIQRKRWLGDDTEFLKLFWDSYNDVAHEPDTFANQWLNTLFFKAFNNKYNVTYNIFPSHIDTILTMAPYLNGGLFSENDLDQKKGFLISDARFQQVFSLLERYNFTIAEDSPLDQEVAVDPEMIGTVYESLVNVSEDIDERGDAGIFYTPRTEIDLMCRLTLVDYLTSHIGEQYKPLLYEVVFAIEQENKEQADKKLKEANLWQAVHDRLNEVKAVDPACGSGAFLVGLLHVLDDLLTRAAHALGLEKVEEYDPYNAYERRKHIIEQSLYGVDIMEWAVHIAELRLWLTLIVEAEYTREYLAIRSEPLLPHFTFKVRCGDSLVQEVGDIKLGLKQQQYLSSRLRLRVNQLKEQKRDFYYNTRQRYTKEYIEQEEQRLFKDLLADRIHSVDENRKTQIRRIESIEAQPQPNHLQGMEGTIALPSTREHQKRLTELEDELAQLQRNLATLRDSKMIPFVWDIAFLEIFSDERGFDIVIGNPPYLRQEKIHTPHTQDDSKEDNKAYKAKLARMVYELFPRFFGYSDAYGRQVVKHPINQQSDLYIYFYLLGLSLLNDKGSFCFITSNSWLDVGYGADLQEFLLKHSHIKLILDNETKRSFANASVNTIIALFSPPDESSNRGLQHTARFVMSKIPFEELLSANIFVEIEAAHERQTRDGYRVFPISQQKLLDEGITTAEEGDEAQTPQETRQKGRKLRETSKVIAPLPQHEAKYSGNKWGGKYLRAPDIYWTIMEKGKDKLVRLGDIAEVRFGIKTGANEFFYLDEAKARQWGIEQQFLVPVIKSPRECKSILIDPHNLKFRLFVCHLSKEELKGTNALKYIQWGESQGFHKRPSCAGRPQWWSVSIDTANSIFVKEANDTSAIFYNPEDYPVDCRLYYANLSPTVIAYLNSAIGAMSFEIYNRAGLGEGARSLMVSDYTQVPVLTQAQPSVELALQNIYALPPRKLIGTQEPYWLDIDHIIFNALGLIKSERDAVYEAVSNLVNARLEKAKSVSTARETRKRVEAAQSLIGIWIGLPEIEDEETAEGYRA